MADTDWERWLEDFRRTWGRAPRVLHIGNIANNAYNNAKVLNDAGFDCDVICYDYYHIMGCPEWEDADFDGWIGDHFTPAWSRVDLRGFQRPRWFAQGPQATCRRYLLARRQRRARAERFWWLVLRLARQPQTRPLARISRGVRRVARSCRATAKRWGHRASAPRLRARALALARGVARAPRKMARSQAARGGAARAPGAVRRALVPFRSLAIALGRLGDGRTPAPPDPVPDAFDKRVRELIALYGRLFPDREDPLEPEDFEPFRSVIPDWNRLFAEYDVIEGYSTDTILPMLAGAGNYVAYEHGTLRDIPFERNARGRLTALSYRLARGTVITNPDCEEAAVRLGIETRRFIPHLIDRKYYDGAIASGGRLPDDVRPPYVFCPARHDWAIKGNDVLLEAFASIAGEHPDLLLVTAAWGEDVDRSRHYLRERGLEDRLVLIRPLHIHDLIRVCRKAEVIVDQFRYGVFGGIGPTALAVGTPLVTHLDHAKSAWRMEKPPYCEAHDAESCAQALRLALDPATRPGGEPMRRWMERNYWYGSVVSRHAELYRDVIANRFG